MSDLGILTYYMGIEVSQVPTRITLSQGAYASKLLERSGHTHGASSKDGEGDIHTKGACHGVQAHHWGVLVLDPHKAGSCTLCRLPQQVQGEAT